MIKNHIEKKWKSSIPGVVVAGWHRIVPQKHWTVSTTIPQTPVAQNVHRYCLGVTMGPSFLASANVRPTGIFFKAFGSASYISIVLFA